MGFRRSLFSVSAVGTSSCKIGVDGGGTKTEFILTDSAGGIIARHLGPGCNPNVTDADTVRAVMLDGLRQMLAASPAPVSTTLLCMAGSRPFWQPFAAGLGPEFGRVVATNDSLPVLELATDGAPGLVLHAGTGSFVAARSTSLEIHYAGGLGWRFGDPGSGYDLGRRAIARALLELQGWQPASRLSTIVRDHSGHRDAPEVTRFFYAHPAANQKIAALAPAVLHLASEGDLTAHQVVLDSVGELFALATRVASQLFPGMPLDTVPTGLSGPILTHAVVLQAFAPRTPLPLVPITAAPIEGVRRMLARH